MTPYTPGVLGEKFVLPSAKGLKRIYLSWFGIPDVRVQLTGCYLVQVLARLSFKSILDVGCGNGMLSCLMASRYPDCSILGIDRSEPGIGFATRLAEQNGLRNARFLAGDLESAELKEKFDVITCLAVLQFINDTASALKKFHDALTPGGYLVLQLPALTTRAILSSVTTSLRSLPDFHEARGGFTEDEIRRHLAESGFEIFTFQNIIKGPTILAKELFYLASSVHPAATFGLSPLLNWITVHDRHFGGLANGMFVVAKKI